MEGLSKFSNIMTLKSEKLKQCKAPVINGELCASKADTIDTSPKRGNKTFSECPTINGNKCPAIPAPAYLDQFQAERLYLCSIYIAKYTPQPNFDPKQDHAGFTFLAVKVGDEYYYNEKTFQTATYNENGRPAHHASIKSGYTIIKKSLLLDQKYGVTRKSARTSRNKQYYKALFEDFFGLSMAQMQQRQWVFFGFGFNYDAAKCDFTFDRLSVMSGQSRDFDNMNSIETHRMVDKMANMMRFALNVARARKTRLVKLGELMELNMRKYVKWCPENEEQKPVESTKYKFTLSKLSQQQDKYELYKGSEEVTYYHFLRQMKVNKDLRQLFINTLRDSRFLKFRLEMPPISAHLKNLAFEFILLDSPGLQSTPDIESFAEHFNQPSGQLYATFLNFSKTSTLIVPTPFGAKTAKRYASIGPFMKKSNNKKQRAQADQLVRQVAIEGAAAFEKTTKTYISTAGGGVAWLHVRLDSRPKYYQSMYRRM